MHINDALHCQFGGGHLEDHRGAAQLKPDILHLMLLVGASLGLVSRTGVALSS